MQKKNDTFSISLENIKNISFDKYDKNFTFIVDGKIYKTSRFYADLISPVVNKYHYTDETINEITIHTMKRNHTNKQEEEKDYFSDFLKLNTFKEQDIDDSHREHYLEYFLQLGNMDEYFRLYTSFFTKITTANIVDRLLFIFNNQHLNGNEEITENLLKYAAINFENISNDEKKKLDIDIISLILNNSNLKLKDEDSLLDFVLDMIEIDDKYSVLFEYVMFSNVKYKTLERFTLKFDLDFMNVKIWNKICDRLLLQNPSNNENKQIIQKPKEKDFNNVFFL